MYECKVSNNESNNFKLEGQKLKKIIIRGTLELGFYSIIICKPTRCLHTLASVRMYTHVFISSHYTDHMCAQKDSNMRV